VRVIRNMKTCIRCLQTKPLTAFWAHCNQKRMPPPDGKLAHCKACGDIERRKWFQANKQYAAAKQREWNKAHPEVVKARYRKRKDDPKYKALMRKHSTIYRNKNREATNQRVAKWQRNNPDKHCAYQAMRRSAKLQATPAWANQFFIREAYHLAKLRTKMLGYPWHVDHIVPLQSPLVCGLHVEHNLQVIPGSDNIAKRNYHWPDMPREIGE